jgi:UDP-N-acetylglucosamine 1-carboxyvinyltransferase
MRWLEVNYSNPLTGTVAIPGAKNSSLALLAACCLADDKVLLHNIPDISDVRVVCNILKDIGAEVSKDNGRYVIDPKGICAAHISLEYSSAYRAAYYFIGSLLAKHKKVTIGYPGGDNFVDRPIDQHIKGLQALGARVAYYEKHYVVEADQLIGTDIYFDCITGGATINLMLAAVLAKGKTVLHNAARDPEVVDTAMLLNAMGAKIYGAGTDTIRINGVRQLGGCEHTVIPDRLIAGAFLIAAGVSGGTVTVHDIVPEHLDSCVDKLREIGMEFTKTDNSITAFGKDTLSAARVRTGKYPMLESDFQQPITALLLKAKGKSLIADGIYPLRFNHCEQLKRMGADITIRSGVARINSNRNLMGTWVHANDIRAGTCLVLAGLMAETTTFITGVEHIERGYENILGDFQSLGASIKMCHNNEAAGGFEEQFLLKNVARK